MQPCRATLLSVLLAAAMVRGGSEQCVLDGAVVAKQEPLHLTLSVNGSFHTIHSTVILTFSLQASSEYRGTAYCAAEVPDGRFFFFNSESGGWSQGDPSNRATWVPYRGEPFFIAAGTEATGVELVRGRIPSPGDYRMYYALLEPSSGALLSTLAEAHLSLFRNSLPIMNRTRHVGDGYDPYMEGWEVPEPEGIRVDIPFTLGSIPAREGGFQCACWGTYYSSDPVLLNGELLGNLPGIMNGNYWHWVSVVLPSDVLRPGENTLTFESYLRSDGHYDDYMVKEATLYYN